jgi:hypothetical protein
MKVWRSGFMRWRSRAGPCGSHHVEARALKCETSVGLTEEVEVEVEVEVWRGGGRRRGLRWRRAVGRWAILGGIRGFRGRLIDKEGHRFVSRVFIVSCLTCWRIMMFWEQYCSSPRRAFLDGSARRRRASIHHLQPLLLLLTHTFCNLPYRRARRSKSSASQD